MTTWPCEPRCAVISSREGMDLWRRLRGDEESLGRSFSLGIVTPSGRRKSTCSTQGWRASPLMAGSLLAIDSKSESGETRPGEGRE
jgi:hypothetical protein